MIVRYHDKNPCIFEILSYGPIIRVVTVSASDGLQVHARSRGAIRCTVRNVEEERKKVRSTARAGSKEEHSPYQAFTHLCASVNEPALLSGRPAGRCVYGRCAISKLCDFPLPSPNKFFCHDNSEVPDFHNFDLVSLMIYMKCLVSYEVLSDIIRESSSHSAIISIIAKIKIENKESCF